jgi:hypothetical protein
MLLENREFIILHTLLRGQGLDPLPHPSAQAPRRVSAVRNGLGRSHNSLRFQAPGTAGAPPPCCTAAAPSVAQAAGTGIRGRRSGIAMAYHPPGPSPPTAGVAGGSWRGTALLAGAFLLLLAVCRPGGEGPAPPAAGAPAAGAPVTLPAASVRDGTAGVYEVGRSRGRRGSAAAGARPSVPPRRTPGPPSPAQNQTLLSPFPSQTIQGAEVVWWAPAEPAQGVLFVAHGCNHGATDWLPPSDACPQCLGPMPEVRAAAGAPRAARQGLGAGAAAGLPRSEQGGVGPVATRGAGGPGRLCRVEGVPAGGRGLVHTPARPRPPRRRGTRALPPCALPTRPAPPPPARRSRTSPPPRWRRGWRWSP